MRICIVDPGFDYSTLAVAEGYYNAFLRLGFEVSEYDSNKALAESRKLKFFECPDCKEKFEAERNYSFNELTEYAFAPLLNTIVQDQIDIIFVVHGYHMNPAVLDSIRRMGCKAALIMTDEPQQIDVSPKWSQYYDFVFVNDRNAIDRHKNSHFMPVAVNDEVFKMQEVGEEYRSDILVAGSFYKERYEFLMDQDLTDCMVEHSTIFVGSRRSNFPKDDPKNGFFRGNKISYEEMAKYVAGNKVNIDIPRDEFRDGIFGLVNTKRVQATCLSPRIFETPLAGSMVLTSAYRQDIFKLFPEDMFPIYGDHTHLVELIEKYLKDEKSRKKIVEKQREYCLEHHTYLQRAKEVCKIMEIIPTKYIDKPIIENRRVINRWEREWKKNYKILKEKKYYQKSMEFVRFKNSKEGKKCSIISNGPSYEITRLFINTEEIMFTVNEASKYEKSDFVVVIHPADDVYHRCFEGQKPYGILLASAVANYNVVEHYVENEEDYSFFHIDIHEESIKKQIMEEYDYPRFGPGLSVAHSAIDCAIYMGFAEINLFGFDFCYYNMQKYAFAELRYIDFVKIQIRMAESASGNPVLTDNTLLESKNAVMRIIEENQEVKFNVYGDGLLYSKNLENLEVIDGES